MCILKNTSPPSFPQDGGGPMMKKSGTTKAHIISGVIGALFVVGCLLAVVIGFCKKKRMEKAEMSKRNNNDDGDGDDEVNVSFLF